MNSATFFFLYILPLLIAGIVWLGILVSDHSLNDDKKIHPGE